MDGATHLLLGLLDGATHLLLISFLFFANRPDCRAFTMNHQSLTQRFFRYVPALFTLTALGLVGWAVVDRSAPSTTAAAVSLTTTSAADNASSAAGADVRRRIEDVSVGDLAWAYSVGYHLSFVHSSFIATDELVLNSLHYPDFPAVERCRAKNGKPIFRPTFFDSSCVKEATRI